MKRFYFDREVTIEKEKDSPVKITGEYDLFSYNGAQHITNKIAKDFKNKTPLTDSDKQKIANKLGYMSELTKLMNTN